MAAKVYNADGSWRCTVKNLGWLLRHWKEVQRFSVVRYQGQLSVCDAVLTAYMRDGSRYETDFASKEVLWNWLGRPVFKTCELTWFGTPTTCGADVRPED